MDSQTPTLIPGARPPWTPTKEGMPGRTLAPNFETPQHPEEEEKVAENPQPEGVPQRTAAQIERRRRKRQRHRKNKRAKALKIEQEAILNSILDSTIAELDSDDDQKENDIGVLNIDFSQAVEVNDDENSDDENSDDEIGAAMQALANGERVRGSPATLKRISRRIWDLSQEAELVSPHERMKQLLDEIMENGPGNTPPGVQQEFMDLVATNDPDLFQELVADFDPDVEVTGERLVASLIFRRLSIHETQEIVYNTLERSPRKGPLPPLDAEAPPRNCMICMEEFEDNNGPRGNFNRYHGRPTGCKCSQDHDICNLCFIRHFRQNGAPCDMPFCSLVHVNCPSCRTDIPLGETIKNWCTSNYNTIDQMEMALRTGATITTREE